MFFCYCPFYLLTLSNTMYCQAQMLILPAIKMGPEPRRNSARMNSLFCRSIMYVLCGGCTKHIHDGIQTKQEGGFKRKRNIVSATIC
jgi:hypothetical protein